MSLYSLWKYLLSFRLLCHSSATCLSLISPLHSSFWETWIWGLKAAVLFLRLNNPKTILSGGIIATDSGKNPQPDFPRKTRPISTFMSIVIIVIIKSCQMKPWGRQFQPHYLCHLRRISSPPGPVFSCKDRETTSTFHVWNAEDWLG